MCPAWMVKGAPDSLSVLMREVRRAKKVYGYNSPANHVPALTQPKLLLLPGQP